MGPAGLCMRDARPEDVAPLAQIWLDGWIDAHAAFLPPDVVRTRAPESLYGRLAPMVRNIRVADWNAAPAGFALLLDDEINQFYLAAALRGTGAAAVMMADAVARLQERGVGKAWLACAVGNDRAARFYEKSGWRRVSRMTKPLKTPTGQFPVEVWRYERDIPAGP